MTIYACEKDSITGEIVETQHKSADHYARHLVSSDPDKEWHEVDRASCSLAGVFVKETDDRDYCTLAWSLESAEVARKWCILMFGRETKARQ